MEELRADGVIRRAEPHRHPLAIALKSAARELNPGPVLAVLGGSDPATTQRWEHACRTAEVAFDRIDLLRDDWLDRIMARRYDCLLVRPESRVSLLKQMFDERIAILDGRGYTLYPTRLETDLYENKRLLSYWLRAHDVPHPATHVFCNLAEALEYVANCSLPVVGKSTIGAAGSGVVLLRDRDAARRYVLAAFSRRGLRRRFGPNLKQGALVSRGGKLLRARGAILRKLRGYLAVRRDAQKGYVILQDYVAHTFEWRAVGIGDSYFAHKKLVRHGTASGSKLKGYEPPPSRLLDFVRELCDRHGFVSQAIDLFETSDGRFLVNELQTIFGQSDPHQMIVGGVPGRYRHDSAGWVFEAGEFNSNESFDLRLLDVLGRLRQISARATRATSSTD